MTENDSQAKHREWLIEAEHTATRDFDKAILTLSTGALGISIAFIDKLVPHPYKLTLCFLVPAWGFLTLSLLSILVSFLTSQFELRKAIDQLDASTAGEDSAGGHLTSVTTALNVLAAVTLIFGIFSLILFAFFNMKGVTTG